MANTPQSIKRARQNETRRKINQRLRTKFRTMVKRTRAVSPQEAKAAFGEMQSVSDRAARFGLIHRNKAARLKMRINKMLRAAAKAAPAAAPAAASATPPAGEN